MAVAAGPAGVVVVVGFLPKSVLGSFGVGGLEWPSESLSDMRAGASSLRELFPCLDETAEDCLDSEVGFAEAFGFAALSLADLDEEELADADGGFPFLVGLAATMDLTSSSSEEEPKMDDMILFPSPFPFPSFLPAAEADFLAGVLGSTFSFLDEAEAEECLESFSSALLLPPLLFLAVAVALLRGLTADEEDFSLWWSESLDSSRWMSESLVLTAAAAAEAFATWCEDEEDDVDFFLWTSTAVAARLFWAGSESSESSSESDMGSDLTLAVADALGPLRLPVESFLEKAVLALFLGTSSSSSSEEEVAKVLDRVPFLTEEEVRTVGSSSESESESLE